MNEVTDDHAAIIRFWFTEIRPEQWWAVDPAFDALLCERFGDTLVRAVRGKYAHWREQPLGRLAEIIVLDQFSRNIYRGRPQAFAQDLLALTLSREAVAQGVLAQLQQPAERTFLLMPYMHSESAAIHAAAEPLFRAWTPEENYQFELRHKAIIDRFGRYPHRNRMLGRASSAEEEEFLLQPGSSF